MARTESTSMELGWKAPDFNLFDTMSESYLSLDEVASDTATVIVFMCNHCPFVKHILDKLVEVADEYIPQDISFVAISSNDIQEYPEDSPQKMKDIGEIKEFPFPYLFDETQEVAKAYGAVCTPDFYVFDGELKCRYHGRFDDSSPGKETLVTGTELINAIHAIQKGEPVPEPQVPSIGCNIKWKED